MMSIAGRYRALPTVWWDGATPVGCRCPTKKPKSGHSVGRELALQSRGIIFIVRYAHYFPFRNNRPGQFVSHFVMRRGRHVKFPTKVQKAAKHAELDSCINILLIY